MASAGERLPAAQTIDRRLIVRGGIFVNRAGGGGQVACLDSEECTQMS